MISEKIRWKSGKHMTVQKRGEVVYLTFPSLENKEGFLHGFSTRLGGVSQGCLSSMNISRSFGEPEENVRENLRRLADAIGFSPENIVLSHQTHTTNIRVVTEKDRGCGYDRPRDYTDVDGLITNVPGLVLTTSYADCVPLFLVDPVHRAVGLSHSGWRGTVRKIGLRTVREMTENYGTDPGDIIAAIGPSICQDCYEVSGDVIREFENAFPERLHELLFYKKENGKYQLNLWEAARQVFLEAGIPEKNISLPGICTCCNPDLLFSHRATGGKRGNLAAFLGIRDQE